MITRKTDRQKDRETERQKDRKTERQKDRKTERQKGRKTERRKDGKTERERDKTYLYVIIASGSGRSKIEYGLVAQSRRVHVH